jgi:hypothetical protein
MAAPTAAGVVRCRTDLDERAVVAHQVGEGPAGVHPDAHARRFARAGRAQAPLLVWPSTLEQVAARGPSAPRARGTRCVAAAATCARSSAFRVGLPPGHARRTRCRGPPPPRTGRRAAASGRSTGDNVTHRPRCRSNPSASTVGADILPGAAASVATRARRSSSAPGSRIQSSRGSMEEGAARLADEQQSRRPDGSEAFQAAPRGQRINTTSVRPGCVHHDETVRSGCFHPVTAK